MKKKNIIVTVCAIAFILIVFLLVGAYNFACAPVDKTDETIVPFRVEAGDTYSSLGDKLKEQGLIRSTFCYKIQTKLSRPENLYVGYYPLSPSMNMNEIVSIIANGETYIPNAKMITFREGLTVPKVAAVIAENTDYTVEDVYKLLSDETYLDSLIAQYWFLTDEIKSPKIYYSLEGYLFPETYEIDTTGPLEDIFATMLAQTDKILSENKDAIMNNPYGYTVHEILTVASIVEQEAAGSDDRSGVAGVFYNRLKAGMALGSDVTTYYGVQVEMSERDLFQSELDQKNAYNTRHSSMAGKLPIGPICNPGEESILAAINPTSHNYYFFVADKNKKTYFTKTNSEHEAIIRRLKDEGLWFDYDE